MSPGRGCYDIYHSLPTGKMKLEFLGNPISTFLAYSRISNLIQDHFWDFIEIACWYWPDLAIIQATKLGFGRISLNFKQISREFKLFQLPENRGSMLRIDNGDSEHMCT